MQKGDDIDGESTFDYSGIAVDIADDGKTLAVGAYGNDGGGNTAGHVRAFGWSQYDQAWSQKGQDIDGEAARDRSGAAVALSADGSTLAIGATGNTDGGKLAGHVRVYNYDSSASQWVQYGGDIDGEAEDMFGTAVDMAADGKTLIVGAPARDRRNNGHFNGHARVFMYDTASSDWVQKGPTINGEHMGDQSGQAVRISLDGNVVALGAPSNNGAGHVRVYEFQSSDSTWVQKGVDIDGEAASDFAGYAIAMDGTGNNLVVGAWANSGWRGHVRAYTWSGTFWTQKGSDIDGENAQDYSGRSVGMSSDGTTLAIGAIGNNGGGVGNRAGHMRAYIWGGSDWIQKGEDIDGEAAGDWSGATVCLSGDGNHTAIGAPYNDGAAGANSGHVRVWSVCPGFR
jgi:hypothetical protein